MSYVLQMSFGGRRYIAGSVFACPTVICIGVLLTVAEILSMKH